MANRRVRPFLSTAGAGLVLATVAALCGPFTGVNVTSADDVNGGSQSSKAPSNKGAAGGRASQARSNEAASTPKLAPKAKAAELPAPPATWQEHCFEHRELVKLVASDDDVAIYFDDAMPRKGIAWMVPFVTKAWRYTKNTYGSFGPDPRLFAIFHQGKFQGGHPSTTHAE